MPNDALETFSSKSHNQERSRVGEPPPKKLCIYKGTHAENVYPVHLPLVNELTVIILQYCSAIKYLINNTAFITNTNISKVKV